MFGCISNESSSTRKIRFTSNDGNTIWVYKPKPNSMNNLCLGHRIGRNIPDFPKEVNKKLDKLNPKKKKKDLGKMSTTICGN